MFFTCGFFRRLPRPGIALFSNTWSALDSLLRGVPHGDSMESHIGFYVKPSNSTTFTPPHLILGTRPMECGIVAGRSLLSVRFIYIIKMKEHDGLRVRRAARVETGVMEG